MSRPITSTWKLAKPWSRHWRSIPARSCWSAMIGIWSSWSPTAYGLSMAARCDRSRTISRLIAAACWSATSPPKAVRPDRSPSTRGAPAAEKQALDRTLADPGAFGEGAALADALKRRAQLERRIAEAEAEWFEAATELERLSEA